MNELNEAPRRWRSAWAEMGWMGWANTEDEAFGRARTSAAVGTCTPKLETREVEGEVGNEIKETASSRVLPAMARVRSARTAGRG